MAERCETSLVSAPICASTRVYVRWQSCQSIVSSSLNICLFLHSYGEVSAEPRPISRKALSGSRLQPGPTLSPPNSEPYCLTQQSYQKQSTSKKYSTGGPLARP